MAMQQRVLFCIVQRVRKDAKRNYYLRQVRQSVWKQLVSQRTDFCEILFWGPIFKSVKKIPVSLKSDKITGHCK